MQHLRKPATHSLDRGHRELSRCHATLKLLACDRSVESAFRRASFAAWFCVSQMGRAHCKQTSLPAGSTCNARTGLRRSWRTRLSQSGVAPECLQVPVLPLRSGPGAETVFIRCDPHSADTKALGQLSSLCHVQCVWYCAGSLTRPPWQLCQSDICRPCRTYASASRRSSVHSSKKVVAASANRSTRGLA